MLPKVASMNECLQPTRTKKNETPHFNFPQHFSQQVCGPHFMMNNAKSHRHDQSPVALDVTFGQPEKKQIQRFNFHYLRQIYRGENSHTHIACCQPRRLNLSILLVVFQIVQKHETTSNNSSKSKTLPLNDRGKVIYQI